MAAVSVDDPDTVTIRRSGDRVLVEVEGEDPAALRRTLDDLIACLGAAERTAGIVKSTGQGRGAKSPTPGD